MAFNFPKNAEVFYIFKVLWFATILFDRKTL
jgi:hypothetical protein